MRSVIAAPSLGGEGGNNRKWGLAAIGGSLLTLATWQLLATQDRTPVPDFPQPEQCTNQPKLVSETSALCRAALHICCSNNSRDLNDRPTLRPNPGAANACAKLNDPNASCIDICEAAQTACVNAVIQSIE